MTTFTTTVSFDGDQGVEVELDLTWASAEPDVGIMGDYIDDWSVEAVEGNQDKHLCADMAQRINDEIGDEKFLEKLYDEGVEADDGYYD